MTTAVGAEAATTASVVTRRHKRRERRKQQRQYRRQRRQYRSGVSGGSGAAIAVAAGTLTVAAAVAAVAVARGAHLRKREWWGPLLPPPSPSAAVAFAAKPQGLILHCSTLIISTHMHIHKHYACGCTTHIQLSAPISAPPPPCLQVWGNTIGRGSTGVDVGGGHAAMGVGAS